MNDDSFINDSAPVFIGVGGGLSRIVEDVLFVENYGFRRINRRDQVRVHGRTVSGGRVLQVSVGIVV